MNNNSPIIVYSKKSIELLERYRLFEGCYFIPTTDTVNKTINGDQYIVDIHGSGVCGNKFIAQPIDFFMVIDTYPTIMNPNIIGKYLKGSICVYAINKTRKKVNIIPDPLGAGMLFYYDSSEITVFSNNINDLIKLLKKLDLNLNKSFDYISEMIATGNGGFFETSYENVSVIDMFQFVEIKKQNCYIHDFNWKTEFFISDIDYEDLITLALQEINNNIRAVINYKNSSHKIAHLTGGFDSRLVLAGILNNGSQDEFSFFTSGRPQLPDKKIALNLASHYGLKSTNFSGYIHLKEPITIREKLLWPLKFSGGLNSSGPHAYNQKSSNIILSGGYGGVFRSIYGRRVLLKEGMNTDYLLENLWWKSAFPTKNSEGLISEEFKNKFTKKIEEFFNRADILGLRKDAHLDYMFLKTRNRYYISLISNLWSNFNARFDPLYSIYGIKCALSISQKFRNANILGLDLMDRLFEGLSSLPFDREIFSEEYIKIRGNRKTFHFKKNYPIKYTLGQYIKPSKEVQLSKTTNTHIEKAKKINAPLWQIVELKRVQQECMELISGIPKKQIESMFNRKILYRLLRSDLNNRIQIRMVFFIYSMLLWYFDKD